MLDIFCSIIYNLFCEGVEKLKKQKTVINAVTEYAVPFTADQVRQTLAKKAGWKSGELAVIIQPDGSAIVRYTVFKG
jgi:hypothetical protein